MHAIPIKIKKPSIIEIMGNKNLMSVTAIAIAPPTMNRIIAPIITRISNVMMKLPKR